MLTPPPVECLGGGPACFPYHHFLFGSLSGGRRRLSCLTLPKGMLPILVHLLFVPVCCDRS